MKQRRKTELTDKQLVADAWRELKGAPRTKTFGTASSSRSRAFSAKRRGLCGRCGRWIDRGTDVRYVKGFEGPVHWGCRAPEVTIVRIEQAPVTTGIRQPTVCAQCHLQHSGECF